MNALKRYVYTGIASFSCMQLTLAEIDAGTEKVDDGLKWPNTGDPIATIQTFIKGLLTLLGIIMVVMAMYGGYKILTSGAEDEGKEAGKKIIINAVIGIVVIFFAWTLTDLIFKILSGDTFAT